MKSINSKIFIILLKLLEESKFRVFENRVLRKKFVRLQDRESGE